MEQQHSQTTRGVYSETPAYTRKPFATMSINKFLGEKVITPSAPKPQEHTPAPEERWTRSSSRWVNLKSFDLFRKSSGRGGKEGKKKKNVDDTHILMFSWYCFVSDGWLYSGCDGERQGWDKRDRVQVSETEHTSLFISTFQTEENQTTRMTRGFYLYYT